jgi:hypothetical protein
MSNPGERARMKPAESVALAAAQAWVLARCELHRRDGADAAAALERAIDDFQEVFPDYPSWVARELREAAGHFSIS